TCRKKKCDLPHVDRAGQIRKHAAQSVDAGVAADNLKSSNANDSDLSSEEDDYADTDGDDVDSDDLEDEILVGVNDPGHQELAQQNDFYWMGRFLRPNRSSQVLYGDENDVEEEQIGVLAVVKPRLKSNGRRCYYSENMDQARIAHDPVVPGAKMGGDGLIHVGTVNIRGQSRRMME
ncbi:MAG: hypothetical protein Q9180_003782, partial [Flavoplaca navasiana]